MRGRRVGEAAAGVVDRLVEAHIGTSHSEIILTTQGLRQKDRDMILRDFQAAHKHLTYNVSLKLAVFQCDPPKILGLAHWDLATARRCCQDAFDLARADGPGAACHPWVDDFLRFIQHGADLAELKHLALFRARLRFIPVVETYIEARHKDVKVEGKMKHNVAASRVSSKLRAAEIERYLRDDPQSLAHLAKVFRIAENVGSLTQHAPRLPPHLAVAARAPREPGVWRFLRRP